MEPAPASLVVESARAEERTAALEVFFQHFGAEERAARIDRVGRLLGQGELDADGLIVCRAGGRMVGAGAGVALPGATGLVWPPSAVAGPQAQVVEDHLVQGLNRWLRQRGCKFGQALLDAEEIAHGAALLRNGYTHITDLFYLKKDLAEPRNLPGGRHAPGLMCEDYTSCPRELFHSTLLASYQDTLDCPELNDARTADEIVTGYLAMPGCRPERWWLARLHGEAAAVLVLTEVASASTWDLTYLGVVPAARGRGVGRVLTHKALTEARATGAAQITLTLDARNRPASQLYGSFGFDVFDRRAVYLALFTG
jgi:ribosomal protein S18 acetylase RimI-like enzyme